MLTVEDYRYIVADPKTDADTRDKAKAILAGMERSARPRVAIDWPTFWTEDFPDEDWVLEPLVPVGGQVSLFSQAKAGKSLLVLEMVAAAVTGRSVLGQRATEPIRAMYVDQEMTRRELRDRLESFGYGPQDDLGGLVYYQLQRYPPLDTPEGGDAILADAEAHGVDIVVLDTACRVVDGEEDRADTWQAFYRNTGLALKNAGIALLRLDHAGKDKGKGARGSSAKNDDVDGVFLLEVVAEDKAEGTATIRLSNTHRRGELLHDLTVHRTRTEDGLTAHVLAETGYVGGVAGVAAEMDRLGVPVAVGVREGERLFKAAGGTGRLTTIRDAIKYRKTRVPGRDTPPVSQSAGHTTDTQVTGRTHPDTAPVSACPPLKGDTRQDTVCPDGPEEGAEATQDEYEQHFAEMLRLDIGWPDEDQDTA
ncbi:MAG: AAA family ATPase [Acidimicrobiales bacterium]